MRAAFGAAGTVGRALAREWGRTGGPFRGVGRSEERLRRDFTQYGDLVEYSVADLTDPRAAARAAEGVDTIFYTVGVPYTEFGLHPVLTRTVLDAAASVGVQR